MQGDLYGPSLLDEYRRALRMQRRGQLGQGEAMQTGAVMGALAGTVARIALVTQFCYQRRGGILSRCEMVQAVQHPKLLGQQQQGGKQKSKCKPAHHGA
jgi:hypothetical protein